MDNTTAKERAELWKRRLSPPRRFRFAVGTMAVSDMWRGGYSNIDQLRNWKRYVRGHFLGPSADIEVKAMPRAYMRRLRR